MSTQNTAQEPTMEEILASIRRIISEDTDAEGHVAPEQAAAPAAYAPPPPPPVEELEDDIGFEEEAEVLELTEALPDEPMAEPEPEYLADPEPAPMPAPMPEPVYAPEPQPEPYQAANDMHDLPDDAEEYLPEDEPENEYDDVAFEEPSMTGILSPQTESAAAAAFGALSSSIQTASGGARTLEDLVADMLRPLLKDYLDAKLPELVERLVKEEIERVARRAR